MQSKPKIQQPVGLSIADIYYVVFRRKWLILGFIVVSVVAAVVYMVRQPPSYRSEAKLFIRFVQEDKPLTAPGEDPRLQSLNARADNILNTEMEILSSLDLAQEVAVTVGPEKILAKFGGGKDPSLAAAVVRKGLLLEVANRSSVIRVLFQHPDSQIVQPVLTQIIEAYFRKHLETHRAAGLSDNFLTRETDELKSKMNQTEKDLRQAKLQAGVISVEDVKKAYTEEISKIRQELFQAEAELAERLASFTQLTNHGLVAVKTDPSSNAPATSPTKSEKTSEYRSVCAQLDSLWRKQQDYQTLYTSENSLVKELRDQIADAEARKKTLEQENPELLAVAGISPGAVNRGPDLLTESSRLSALQARIAVLTNQLAEVRAEANSMTDSEARIVELQRQKDLAEADYRYYSSKLKQSRFDQSIGDSKLSNISKIQAPSPPMINAASTMKAVGGILFGGFACGIGLAFLLELALDRSVKRPVDIERRLNIPLLLTVPDQHRNGHSRRQKKLRKKLLLEKNSTNGHGTESTNGHGNSATVAEVAPWDDRHLLHRFYEGLRDRLVTYFEVRQLTHKPKLIGMAGCARGAGVSTMAAGLAACLSETGDGNVLLVDMNTENGATTHFHQGKPACDLAAFLENGSPQEAMVQDKLYAVREGGNGDKLPRILPKKFTYLVPKLKASEYDYIIFDMPMVSQISVTPRLAGFMDMVLMVVEAEKTDREALDRACDMLTEAKANVAVVLNKVHNYVPRRLLQEMPGDV